MQAWVTTRLTWRWMSNLGGGPSQSQNLNESEINPGPHQIPWEVFKSSLKCKEYPRNQIRHSWGKSQAPVLSKAPLVAPLCQPRCDFVPQSNC